jgi:hypothetical protein
MRKYRIIGNAVDEILGQAEFAVFLNFQRRIIERGYEMYETLSVCSESVKIVVAKRLRKIAKMNLE